MSFVRFTPVMRFYWDVFRLSYAGHTFLSVCLAFDHACCLPHSAKQNGLRYVAFLFRRGSRSPIARSRIAGAVIRLGWFTSGLRVFCGDPDGIRKKRGDAENGVGGAARVRFCVIILALLCFPRGVRWGYAPQTAPRRLVSLDSLHLIRGRVRFTRRGETRVQRRLDRLQFMAGQVGLYSDHINTLKRPDSSRPAAAARSRVACAKRCGCRHCRPRAKRCVSGHCLPLDPACRAPRAASPPDARADLRERSARGRCPWESPRR